MELKGTKTEKNLMEAFAGESQARNKYTFFASMAKKEGYEQLAAIFEETDLQTDTEHKQDQSKILQKRKDGLISCKSKRCGHHGTKTKTDTRRDAYRKRLKNGCVL